MKIVHIEEFFHPEAGYQVNLLARIQAAQGEDITVIAAELDKMPEDLTSFFGAENIEQKDADYTDETGVNIRRVPLLGFYSGRAIFRPWALRRVIKEEKPDVLFVHSEDTLTGIVFIWLSPILPFALFLDDHMVEMASLNRFREVFRRFYQRFVTPVILRRNIPLVRIVDSDFVQKCLGIPLEHTHLLPLGTDTSRFTPDDEARSKMRKTLDIDEDDFVVIYAGKLDETKGGVFLTETLAQQLNPRRHEAITFLVVGTPSGDKAEVVEAGIRASANRVVHLPTQPYTQLPDLYRAADLAIYPKQCSLSFFDAQATGLPVVFEDNEINHLRIDGPNASTFTPGDAASFREAISNYEGMSDAERAASTAAARSFVESGGYDFVPIAHRFTELIHECHAEWEAKRNAG